MVLDAGLYAHHVFKAFDANRNGAISFRVSTIYLVDRDNEHILVKSNSLVTDLTKQLGI